MTRASNFGARSKATTTPVNTAPPAIAGTVKTGNSVTVTPGTWTGSPSLTYALKRGSTAIVGPGASKATVEAYVMIALDCYSPLTLVETDSVGATSATSNALTYVLPTSGLLADWDGTHVTLSSGRVSALLDQSGLGHDLTQLTAPFQPIQNLGGGPNGRDAIDFALNAGNITRLASTNVGIVATTVTTYSIFQIPGTSHYLCDGGVANSDSRVIAGTAAPGILMYAGNVGPTPGCPAVNTWIHHAGVWNGASSKAAVNGGTDATGDVGPNTAVGAGHTLGSQSIATATTGFEKLFARQVIYGVAHSDADRADITQFLMGWAGL